jgi:hypothetical protein
MSTQDSASRVIVTACRLVGQLSRNGNYAPDAGYSRHRGPRISANTLRIVFRQCDHVPTP